MPTRNPTSNVRCLATQFTTRNWNFLATPVFSLAILAFVAILGVVSMWYVHASLLGRRLSSTLFYRSHDSLITSALRDHANITASLRGQSNRLNIYGQEATFSTIDIIDGLNFFSEAWLKARLLKYANLVSACTGTLNLRLYCRTADSSSFGSTPMGWRVCKATCLTQHGPVPLSRNSSHCCLIRDAQARRRQMPCTNRSTIITSPAGHTDYWCGDCCLVLSAILALYLTCLCSLSAPVTQCLHSPTCHLAPRRSPLPTTLTNTILSLMCASG